MTGVDVDGATVTWRGTGYTGDLLTIEFLQVSHWKLLEETLPVPIAGETLVRDGRRWNLRLLGDEEEVLFEVHFERSNYGVVSATKRKH